MEREFIYQLHKKKSSLLEMRCELERNRSSVEEELSFKLPEEQIAVKERLDRISQDMGDLSNKVRRADQYGQKRGVYEGVKICPDCYINRCEKSKLDEKEHRYIFLTAKYLCGNCSFELRVQ